MALDWNAPLCTSHNPPRLAIFRKAERDGRRSVVALGDSQMALREDLRDRPTTWLYNDEGCCSVIGEPNDFDLVNYVPADVSPVAWIVKS